ncbi:FAD-dependent oxidoreductase [Nocardioides sp. TRM66260-LWL]|uniref:FAD-dependent oxidoreductase n=1 Tax=Nocardioides sp. TRM66260-LWL TaxID=2874478 RepID=UPI001CC40B7F|nr:FAD-dependent oxidoreductase [Nocardioides sp. TRM66260-LWL]MBZ5735262.1 FAD-dependent oxidoreductase [Nocardioides sp. TRM66260-LWL]
MTRVLVAGLGDTGVLVAGHLARRRDVEVVGVGAAPGLLSGQELGVRLARPDDWRRGYWWELERLRRLDAVRAVHGAITGVDLSPATGPRSALVRRLDGSIVREPFDALVVATGVRSGFWRRPEVRTADAVAAELAEHHTRLRDAASIAVVGGGSSAVAAAANLGAALPRTRIELHHPHAAALREHHPRVWTTLRTVLRARDVAVHGGRRALLPDEVARAVGPTVGPVRFEDGPDADVEAVVWAVGQARPNTGWLPPALLDADGFVRVDPFLRVPGAPGVWAVGDVAATDPQRGSARNRADLLLARNLLAALDGRPDADLRAYRPRPRRWGSVLGVQDDGLTVFTPGGRGVRISAPVVHRVLQPLVVERGIHGGVRPPAG